MLSVSVLHLVKNRSVEAIEKSNAKLCPVSGGLIAFCLGLGLHQHPLDCVV